MEDQNKFSGWAKVEVMGHLTHFGYVTTVYFGTAGFFRVDVPEIPEEEEITQSHRRNDSGELVPAGSKIKRPAIAGGSPMVGCGSIYQITPCTEAAALEAIRRSVHRPFTVVDLAKPIQIAASFDAGRCADCGKAEANCECECPLDEDDDFVDVDTLPRVVDGAGNELTEDDFMPHVESSMQDTMVKDTVPDVTKFYSPTEGF